MQQRTSKAGTARMAKLSKRARSALAKQASAVRWEIYRKEQPMIRDSTPPDRAADLSRIIAAVMIGQEHTLSDEDRAVLAKIRDEAKRVAQGEPAKLPHVEIRDDVRRIEKKPTA